MKKLNKNIARMVFRTGAYDTKKYHYWEDMEKGCVYRCTIEMLDTTDILDAHNHEFICTHKELCDLAF